MRHGKRQCVRESVCPGRNKWFLPANGPAYCCDASLQKAEGRKRAWKNRENRRRRRRRMPFNYCPDCSCVLTYTQEQHTHTHTHAVKHTGRRTLFIEPFAFIPCSE